MKVTDLEGNITDWKLKELKVKEVFKSQLHSRAKRILKELHPTINILEEVPIKIRFGEALYLDFYIPIYNTAIEVQGKQHFEYSYRFYNTRLQFYKQVKNDREKAEWCHINNIQLITLMYNEDEQIWRKKLRIC